MVAQRPQPVTPRHEGTVTLLPYVNTNRTCTRCRKPVHTMRTYLGRPLTFDAAALPRQLDILHEGWIPGIWPVHGRRQLALAPVGHYPPDKRERINHVVVLHRCRAYLAAHALHPIDIQQRQARALAAVN